jgi:hypothetical protein
MRNARGYLDALVRSARPSPTATAVSAVRRPDWAPTRMPDPGTEIDTGEPSPPLQPAPRPRVTRLPTRVAPPVDATQDAAPPATQPRAQRGAVPPLPVVVTRVEERSAAPAAVVRDAVDPVGPRRSTREPSPTAPPAPPVPPPIAQVRLRDGVAPTPRLLPAGSEVAFERLERLARRFAATVPVEAARTAPTPAPVPHPESPVEHPARVVPAEPITLAPVPSPGSRETEPARVQIGAIEVFVTQPPAPQPVAPPVPQRIAVPSPGPAERLSRPPHPYGVGQG